MSGVKNLKASGAIKNGEIIGRLDFDNSVDDIAIVKQGTLFGVFYKQDANPWRALTKEIMTSAGWTNDSNSAIANFAKAIEPYCQPTIVADTITFVQNTTETGLYFDGVNKISTAPVVPKTAEELFKEALGGSGTDSTPDTTVKWYAKPLNIVLIIGGVIGLGFLIKKFA